MAQLRDAKTSELILEGTPLELALAANELGRDEVLFDDVGDHFDPDAVVAAARERADGLATAAKVAKGDERKRLDEAAKAAKAELVADGTKLGTATKDLERARKRLEG